ncbi:helix-turn-helix transcriptional regulator [Acinetobacter baumannii]|nr:helix-turn-helix transcriptional regulator [Acinetobacter baumannii]
MEDKVSPNSFDLEEFRIRVKQGNDPHGPVRETLSRLGDRWTPLMLLILRNGIMRYTQLLKEINTMADTPVSQRILTLKLRACERDGFILRKVIPTVPPQVEYSLTPLGENIVQELDRLISWLECHSSQIQKARESYDLLNSK